MRPRTLLALLGSVLFALGGVQAADHPYSFSHNVQGGLSLQERIVVPEGAQELRIQLDVSLSGGIALSLQDSRGAEQKSDSAGGEVSWSQREWFVQSRPVAGTWVLHIAAGGQGRVAGVASWAPGNAAEGSGQGIDASGWVLAGLLAVAGAGLLAVARPWERWAFLLPFYTRLERDQVLANGHREAILEVIAVRPGLTFSELRQELDLPNGSLVYHLQVLERQGLVRSTREGWRRRLSPAGSPPNEPYLTHVQRRVVEAVAQRAGVSQAELARQLGWPRKTLEYQLTRLEDLGMLRRERDGRTSRWFSRSDPVATAPPARLAVVAAGSEGR